MLAGGGAELRYIRRTCVTVRWLRSVTKVTASAIEKKYVDGMRAAGKPSDAEQRRGIAEKAMTGACAGFDNYAITGEKGKRTFADFNKVRTRRARRWRWGYIATQSACVHVYILRCRCSKRCGDQQDACDLTRCLRS